MAVGTLSGAAAEQPREPVSAGGTRGAAPAPGRRVALARAIVRILARTIPDDAPLTVALDGDTAPGTAAAGADIAPGTAAAGADIAPDTAAGAMSQPEIRRAHVRFHGPDAVSRLVLRPTEDGLAEGFLRDDLDIDGDVASAIEAARRMDFRRLAPADVRRLARYALELRRGRVAAQPLRRLAHLTGRRHSRARDLEAVRFHYDVGETFYQLWLDRRLTYSCAYFEGPDDPAAHLDAAQEAKLDLICRKLDLRPGQRLLDIGCGWGSLILFAAERYNVDAVGVTLSEVQASEANRRARLLGVETRARAEVRDYRDLAALGAFDAVASVGMFEHVGAGNLRVYFDAAHEALVPGGRFLNHGIATNERRRRSAVPRRTSGFVEKYVFPDGELVPVEQAVAVAREAGFERGDLDVAQLLLARPREGDRPSTRPLRPWWQVRLD